MSINAESLYKMSLGDTIWMPVSKPGQESYSETLITRVPGGWLFDGVYVPYNDEFKPMTGYIDPTADGDSVVYSKDDVTIVKGSNDG